MNDPSSLLPFVSEFTPAGLLGLGVAMMMAGWLLPIRVVRGWMNDKNVLIQTQADYIKTLERANAIALRGTERTTETLLAQAREADRDTA